MIEWISFEGQEQQSTEDVVYQNAEQYDECELVGICVPLWRSSISGRGGSGLMGRHFVVGKSSRITYWCGRHTRLISNVV